jgi:PiT family inorganic phosphate transporter/sodium-dependent phosphate transporter
MLIGTVMEFLGAMIVGARVTDTIHTKVISTKLFEEDPSVLMLGMVCAVVGHLSTSPLLLASPCPCLHRTSIMGGVISVGIAAIGTEGELELGRSVARYDGILFGAVARLTHPVFAA